MPNEEPIAAESPAAEGVGDVSPPPDAAEPSELAIALERVAALEAETASLRDAMLRALADSQNQRRRASQEIARTELNVASSFATKLLPALDNFERTLAAVESGASLESVLEGIRLVERQLREALEQNNVEHIVAVGQHFDPYLHEAIQVVVSEEEAGTVVAEFEKGYKIGDRVLRPSKVQVSQGPGE